MAKQFNEADRDQYGGDIALAESTRNAKTGQTRRVLRHEYEHTPLLHIGPGDLVFKADPSVEMHFKWIEMDDHTYATEQYINAVNEGYQFVTTDDFSIRPTLRQIWKGNTEKIVTLGGKDKGTLAPMWVTAERFHELELRERRTSDSIDKDLKDKMSQAADQINRGGDPLYRVQEARVDLADETSVETVTIR